MVDSSYETNAPSFSKHHGEGDNLNFVAVVHETWEITVSCLKIIYATPESQFGIEMETDRDQHQTTVGLWLRLHGFFLAGIATTLVCFEKNALCS